MERYQVILAYDGTRFHGSQIQNGVRTIQGALEQALRKLNWRGKSVLMAGRTDTGVHALGQVAAFDLEWNHTPVDLRNALNALLPEDMAIRQLRACPPDFHPRFHATYRGYHYRIYCQPVRDPLRERYAWRVWPKPDVDLLRKASGDLLGVHDFAAYGRPMSSQGSTVRHLMRAQWHRDEDELLFEVTANAFLYHMVRRLVFVLVAVGQQRLDSREIQGHLKSPPAVPLQGLAPPQGLVLVEVGYPGGQGENNEKESGRFVFRGKIPRHD